MNKSIVLSCEEVAKFEPKNEKTILILLLDSYHDKLQHSEKFYKIFELYTEQFNAKIAEEFLEQLEFTISDDVKSYDLVVHCRAGQSRSPTMLIALNEIYKLGLKNLKENYPHYDKQIYKDMMKASKITRDFSPYNLDHILYDMGDKKRVVIKMNGCAFETRYK